MPIIKPTDISAPVYYPKNDYSVAKYLDLTKFISLLTKRSLFFCRVDKLEDQFEGTIAKPNFNIRVKWHQIANDFMDVPLTEEQILNEVKVMYEFDEKMRSLHCVNCWNKYNGESAALWKVYSDFSKGIMIKSSISKIIHSLDSVTNDISLSEIKYIDYKIDRMPDGNSMYPLIYKQKAYSFEEEIRLIYQVPYNENWTHDWEKEEVLEGVYMHADIDQLIDEVIISPYSPKWFFELINDISKKYGLNKPINKSQLSLSE